MDTALDALAKPGRQNIPNIAQDVEKTATGGDIVAHTPTSQGPLIVEGTLYAGNQFPLSGLAGKQQIVISSPPQPPTIGTHQQRGETRMSSAESIRKAVVATAYLTDKISPDDRSAPTPCDQFNLHGLVSHMADVFAMSAAAATKNGPTSNPPEQVTPYDSLTELGANLVIAWATPDAFEGRTHLGTREMSAFFAGHITLFEILVHSWDLAMATGQQLELSRELADATLVTAQRLCTQAARDTGAFGIEIIAAPQFGPFERALALTGRDPNWSA